MINRLQNYMPTLKLCGVAGILLITLLSACRTVEKSAQKETMMYQNIEPNQALERLNSQGGYRYVDVRTVEEFAQGHPVGAVNVPVSHRDPASGKMVPNPDFVAVMQRNFKADQPIILGCRSGGRSVTAAKMLGEAGYQNLYNMTGGYVGAFDMGGQCTTKGWSMQGLPSSTDAGPGVSYESLRK